MYLRSKVASYRTLSPPLLAIIHPRLQNTENAVQPTCLHGLALSSHASSLYGCLQSFWRRPTFAKLKLAIEQLSRCLAQYGDYLRSQNKCRKQAHASPTPICQLSNSLSIDVIKKSLLCFQCFGELCSTLCDTNNYQHLCLTDLCPTSLVIATSFYKIFIIDLIDISVVLIILHSPGNNHGNLHFIWKFDDSEPLETVFQRAFQQLN